MVLDLRLADRVHRPWHGELAFRQDAARGLSGRLLAGLEILKGSRRRLPALSVVESRAEGSRHSHTDALSPIAGQIAEASGRARALQRARPRAAAVAPEVRISRAGRRQDQTAGRG